MKNSKHITRLFTFTLLSLVAILGCQAQNATSPTLTTTTPTAPPPKTLPAPQHSAQMNAPRILAAVVPHDNQAWYLKVTGKAQLLDAVKPEFIALLKSMSFPNDKPAWTLPENWKQNPASGMRFATLVITHKKQTTELSVISLSQTPILPQVNRWRGQLGLKPVTEKQLPQDVQTIKHNKLTITLADITGAATTQVAPATTISAIASGSTPAGHPAIPTQAPNSNHSSTIPSKPLPSVQSYYKIDYKAPEGWTELPTSGMRVAAFQVGPTQVTVIPLSTTAGDLTANVNRWRGQVELPALTEKEILDQANTIDIDSIPGHWVHLTGPNEKSMLGLIAINQTRAWFVKILGPANLINAQKQNFLQFAKSIRFGK